MSRSKRLADSDPDEDEDRSISGSSDISYNATSTTRKRRRISNDTGSVSNEAISSRQGDTSTPQSDYGNDVEEDDDEAEQAATQAIRSQKEKERERGNNIAECGILQKVDIVNFMCHKEFTYNLGPNINFICGKNGSGKSAILTAIILCLGGKAAATNRGQSLKKFIKEGSDQARIACTIKNQGDTAYLPEEFGNSITVERHFSRSGTSGYRIKNERGRVITTKRADLDNILDYFALQIDNPLNVLSQDQARTFIQTSDPVVKYKYFIRGVQLEQLDQDYSLIEEQVDLISVKLETTKDDIEDLKEKSEKAKQKEEIAKQGDGLRNKSRELRRQYAWVQIKEQEDIRDDNARQIDEIQENIEQAEAHIAELDEVYQASDKTNDEAKVAMTVAEAARNQAQDEQRERKFVFEEAKKSAFDARAESRRIKESLVSNLKEIGKKKAQIESEQQRLIELDGGGAATRLQALEDAKLAAQQATEDFDGHKAGRRNLDATKAEARQNLAKISRQREEIATEVGEHKARLDDLIKHKDQQAHAFKPNTDILLRAINNENRWDQKPIGPLGMHVKLTRPEWSSIIERTFGGTLSGFYVVSKRDADLLGDLKKRVKCDADVFIGNRELITPNEPDEHFDTILRVLEIDNNLVKKQLIINHSIEQTLLIPDLETATKEMYGGGRLQNVKSSFSFHPHNKRKGIMLKYTPSGHASQDPIPEWKGQARMKTNIEATIALARQNFQELKDRHQSVDTEFFAARANEVRAGQAIERHKKREDDLQLAQQSAEDKVSEIEESIKEDSTESGALEALKQGLVDHENEKQLADELYKDAIVAEDQKKVSMQQAHRSVEDTDARIKELEKTLQAKKVEAAETDKKRSQSLLEKNEAISRVDDAKKDKLKLETNKQELDERIVDFIIQARQISERIPVPEGATSENVKAKMERLKEDIRRFEQQRLGMTVQQAAEAYGKAYATYKQAVKDNHNLESIKEQLKQSLVTRKRRWERFRSLISTRAKAMFIYLLSERSFRGELRTDHRRKALEVVIEPDITTKSGSGRNAKTLSGGEKSFSQICLLLSIWEAMGSPIRCLDEFDVYMDAVNRNMSVRMIIEAARESSGRQYILISPGSKQDIPRAPDVNVVELGQPERGQQTLPRTVINA